MPTLGRGASEGRGDSLTLVLAVDYLPRRAKDDDLYLPFLDAASNE